MSKKLKKIERTERLMPNGVPRYVRCYDNGGDTADRYTVVFTGHYKQKTGGEFLNLGMSEDPFHPCGIGCHGSSQTHIDSPTYSHLGKKIQFQELSEKAQQCVIQTYEDLWDLEIEEIEEPTIGVANHKSPFEFGC